MTLLSIFLFLYLLLRGIAGPETKVQHVKIMREGCDLLEQNGYRELAEGNTKNAREQLQKVIDMCPDKIHASFQLGVSYCIEKDKINCFHYMDISIEKAKLLKKNEEVMAYVNEKKNWEKYFQ